MNDTPEAVVAHWFAVREHRSSAHSEQCWNWHPECALQLVYGELVEALAEIKRYEGMLRES